MLEPKLLTREGIPRALERAHRYRLLSEPVDAESICLDVMAVDPQNEEALVTLLLALTDQFEEGPADILLRAREVLPRLPGEYERAYYAGLISERRAKAQLKHGGPHAGYAAYDSVREAMRWYEKAEAIRPPGNDEALLRWNTCVRLMQRRPDLVREPDVPAELPLE